jgi:hypothetical protein
MTSYRSGDVAPTTHAMSEWDDEEREDGDQWPEADVDRAPICTACGVTALLAESAPGSDPSFICENPDCEAFGEVV